MDDIEPTFDLKTTLSLQNMYLSDASPPPFLGTLSPPPRFAIKMQQAIISFDKRLGPQFRLDLEDVLARLRIWATNTNVLTEDSRLYNNSDILDVLASMLKRLKSSIETAVETMIHPILNEADEEEIGTAGQSALSKRGEDIIGITSESGSESGLSPILSSDTSEGVDGSDIEGEGWGGGTESATGPLRSANVLLDNIYRVSHLARSKIPVLENERVREFEKEVKTEEEKEEVKSLEDQVRTHLLAHSKQTSKVLVDRLVAAARFRRMKYWYRKYQQQRIQEEFHKMPAGEPTPAQNSQQPEPILPGQHSLGMGSTSSRTSRSRQSTIFSTAMAPASSRNSGDSANSKTTASSVTMKSKRLNSYSRSTADTRITISASGRRERLDVPPPPKDPNLEDMCPYCFGALKKANKEPTRWK
ncbi:hypothetical protein QBC36DRAFT_60507 [Triangularia setosa]|uniref:Uncharacterized protein n=1 Tax=Triangularia setosa TaxID=2587417 RepID=A0AAN6W1H9_9PEZI|nr:hypothetical protein QBC36DRAFT_60507 [Podospora setosa]